MIALLSLVLDVCVESEGLSSSTLLVTSGNLNVKLTCQGHTVRLFFGLHIFIPIYPWTLKVLYEIHDLVSFANLISKLTNQYTMWVKPSVGYN